MGCFCYAKTHLRWNVNCLRKQCDRLANLFARRYKKHIILTRRSQAYCRIWIYFSPNTEGGIFSKTRLTKFLWGGNPAACDPSIQAEGVFACTKEDLDFRKFLLRGTGNVSTECFLIAITHNVLKLYHKIQKDCLGSHSNWKMRHIINKGVMQIGKTRTSMNAPWSLYAPCP